MLHVNGFINISALMNNTLGQLSPIGEISDNSRTFCKEKGSFTKAGVEGIELVSLHVRDNATGELTQLTQGWADDILEIVGWMYEQAAQGSLGNNATLIAQNINLEFGDVIDTLTVGQAISNGSVILPSSIGFSFLGEAEANSNKIWFADEYIANEYPETEYVIIDPVVSLDSLFLGQTDVRNALASFTRSDLIDKIDEVQAGYPYTNIFGDPYDVVFDNTPAGRENAVWTILGYGPLTTNPDLRKQALIDHILDNSNYDLAAWTERIPSLFISTEAVVIPHWDKNSVPNADVSSSLYSSIIIPNMGAPYLEDLDLPYGDAFIESTYVNVPVTYKGLAITFVCNPLNVDNETTFGMKFPDYLSVAPLSPAFGLMDPKTQRFANLMNNMFPVAELMTPISAVPAGMARIRRGDWTYLGASLDGVLYLVVPRYMIVT